MAVCRPFHAQRVLTIKRARYAQLGVAAFAALYNLVRFWEYKLVITRNENSTWGVPTYERLLRENYSYFIGYYTISYVIVHFFAPFLLISILNALIIKTIAEASALRQRLAPKRNTSNQTCNQPDTAVLKDAKRQGNITRMIVVVTLIFLLCNTLPFVLNIWEALETSLFNPSNPWSSVAYVTLDVSNILVVLNSSTNFILYAIYCRQYRKLCRRYLRRLYRCGRWLNSNDDDGSRRKFGATSNGYFDSLSDVSKATTPLAIIKTGTSSGLASVIVRRQIDKGCSSLLYPLNKTTPI